MSTVPVSTPQTQRQPALPPQGKRWLSQLEVAAELGVTTRTVRNYIAAGELPASRIKGSHYIRIDRRDVERLLRPIPTTQAGQ